ncbi:SulP family inorganic anion transporter [Umboniibacter marinipuniceus]|uniref:SulP family sulfate permease n=1 Tax=Umboniibacter marinipuniceus TaxID=569599 RepID=A0A3M0AED9_9GAMM|nr:sulfate permease [Umboniibacter marinipuniceus]RMA82514.1 SulP family sulfate permease [Umboniibacter marinipuniceus]
MMDWLPARHWISAYSRADFSGDMIAAVIVTILLIPQSLAYAMLAGVPPEVGLYASILPLVAYGLWGTSSTLSVGPVAVVSLMTAATLGEVADSGTAHYLVAAATLALLSGIFLLVMGLLRLGMVTHFLSHAVISGFISASGLIIAFGQARHIFGIDGTGASLTAILPSLWSSLANINWLTAAIGVSVIAFLYWNKAHTARLLQRFFRLSSASAAAVSRATPILAVVGSIAVVFLGGLTQHGVAITGEIPSGLPPLNLTIPSLELVEQLWLPALLISIIGYVESVSVGRTLAAKRREKITPNQELIGLGMANVASSISSGFPVTGGFARSVVNFDAGARTQAASLYTALGIALASLLLTPTLYYLPKAALAATIIVAVLGLIDFSIFRKTWRCARSDFWAALGTVLITLVWGVEVGVASGVVISIALHLYRTSKPHVAEVGLVEGTEHFRNVNRYRVMTDPTIYSVRPDESLFFANASYLDEMINDAIYQRGEIHHVILFCSAVNEVDFSALEMLESLNHSLLDQGIKLHLAEVKGPVLDTLTASGLVEELSGQIFLTQFEAFSALRTVR